MLSRTWIIATCIYIQLYNFINYSLIIQFLLLLIPHIVIQVSNNFVKFSHCNHKEKSQSRNILHFLFLQHHEFAMQENLPYTTLLHLQTSKLSIRHTKFKFKHQESRRIFLFFKTLITHPSLTIEGINITFYK